MDAETTGIVISSGALGALCTLGATYIKAKFGQKARIEPDPLNVAKQDKFVTRGECQNYRVCLGQRIDNITPALKSIGDKIDANEAKAEKRSVDLHRRLDPVVEKVAANSARLDVFERLTVEATKGGRK